MIRAAKQEDASRLAEILIFAKRTAYRSIFHNDFVSFNEMQVIDLALHYRDVPGALNDVYVFDDGIVKGMMSWSLKEAYLNRRELSELYIDPFFQGCGVGTALMNDFLFNAANSGLESVYLWVLEENEKAIGFYQSFGFSRGEERELQPGTDKYLLKYVKVL